MRRESVHRLLGDLRSDLAEARAVADGPSAVDLGRAADDADAAARAAARSATISPSARGWPRSASRRSTAPLPSARGYRRRRGRSRRRARGSRSRLVDVESGRERAVAAALGHRASAVVAPRRAACPGARRPRTRGRPRLRLHARRRRPARARPAGRDARRASRLARSCRDRRRHRLGPAPGRALVCRRDGRGRAARAPGAPPRARGRGRRAPSARGRCGGRRGGGRCPRRSRRRRVRPGRAPPGRSPARPGPPRDDRRAGRAARRGAPRRRDGRREARRAARTPRRRARRGAAGYSGPRGRPAPNGGRCTTHGPWRPSGGPTVVAPLRPRTRRKRAPTPRGSGDARMRQLRWRTPPRNGRAPLRVRSRAPTIAAAADRASSCSGASPTDAVRLEAALDVAVERFEAPVRGARRSRRRAHVRARRRAAPARGGGGGAAARGGGSGGAALGGRRRAGANRRRARGGAAAARSGRRRAGRGRRPRGADREAGDGTSGAASGSAR